MASISSAALLSFALSSKAVERMLSLSVGVMLATSLLHALPDAFASKAGPHALFATVLAGLLTFFFLEKLALMRNAGSADAAPRACHGHAPPPPGSSGWMVMAGDALHNFTDGIMIAAAFLADPGLGVLTGLAIAAHELPQELSDFVVLLNAGYSRTRACVLNLACSLMGVLGGVLGYIALGAADELVPYVLAFASAGFIYISVSHLMPRLQRSDTLKETLPQLLLMAIGIGLVLLIQD
ncbi:MAG: ZIP family metal transporter [Pseudomonadota bacterium]